jgi:hypothetical protein
MSRSLQAPINDDFVDVTATIPIVQNETHHVRNHHWTLRVDLNETAPVAFQAGPRPSIGLGSAHAFLARSTLSSDFAYLPGRMPQRAGYTECLPRLS